MLAGVRFPYKRALFGSIAYCGPYQVFSGPPAEGCTVMKLPYPINNTAEDVPGIVVAERGVCKFEDKAAAAKAMGARAVLVSNTKDTEVRLVLAMGRGGFSGAWSFANRCVSVYS